jgi:hypothetical protein
MKNAIREGSVSVLWHGILLLPTEILTVLSLRRFHLESQSWGFFVEEVVRIFKGSYFQVREGIRLIHRASLREGEDLCGAMRSTGLVETRRLVNRTVNRRVLQLCKRLPCCER